MLVDSHLADFSDYIHTDLFTAPSSASPPSDNDSSPPQSPFHSLLTTPPQDVAFPDFDHSLAASSSASGVGLALLDDDPLKSIDHGFVSLPGMLPISMHYPGSMPMHMSMPIDLPMGFNLDPGMPPSDIASYLGIDPSLVGTPALSGSTSELETVDEEEDEPSHEAPAASLKQKQTAQTDDQPRERLTLTITPAKVGGHGKSRKGTVQSGGIVKKTAVPPSSSRDKENSLLSTTSGQTAASIAANATALKKAKFRASSEASSINDNEELYPSSGMGLNMPNKDDFAIDWRPPPEVLAKMSSKEKRQLRNKISARNFRVRRKEYITTLEGDIAERDRLLDAVRTELGSTQSENLALRHEIAALKKILLEGRGEVALASLNLPPPAPLAVSIPVSISGSISVTGAGPLSVSGASAGETASSNSAPTSGVIDPTLTPHSSATNANLSLALPTPSSPQPSSLGLLTPNTQKDLPTSPRLGAAAFWGGTTRSSFGMGIGGGITPVHTVLVPDLSTVLGGGDGAARNDKSVTRVLQENINPVLNSNQVTKNVNVPSNFGLGSNVGAFEGWADSNLLTMKNLDAYRMHLWGKMAAQQQIQKNQNSHSHRSSAQQLSGLASSLRPHFFSSTSSSYPSPPSTPPGIPMGSTLSALLSGKHSALGTPGSSSSSSYSGLPTPPGSPNLNIKGVSERDGERFREKEKEREQRDQQSAALAVLAGQTLFKKLGGAFWDAFSGHSTSALSTLPGPSAGGKNWDVDKVRKVLEGKAVVRVVDVEPLSVSPSSSSMSSLTAGLGAMTMVGGGGLSEDGKKLEEKSKCRCTEILEESMRSLTLSKKP